MGTRALDAVVTSFVDDVSGALAEATAGLDDIDAASLMMDVTVEAFNLSTAMIDADERHTTDELEALIDAFGHRLPDTQLLMATPDDLRGSLLVVGRRTWLQKDSELFGILVDADRRNETELANRYYERSLDIAHVVASLDVVPSNAELEAISSLRTRLLEELRTRTPTEDRPTAGVPNGPTALHPRVSTDSDDSAEPPAAPTPADPPARPLEELLAELDELIGLEDVKARVHLVADFLTVQRLRAERSLPTLETSHHLVFTGNPGTGKTTVARLLAQIYRTLGVVARGQLVETDRSGLVAGFVGQTAPLVTSRFDEADEGMLFIDEAYTLARGSENDFGREAIDQIVKLMEDRRDRVVLVVAGYPVEMENFLSTNPGLRSRFPTVIDFPDYSTDELIRIVDSIGRKQRYELTDDGRDKFRAVLEAIPRNKGFGNARVARNLFEESVNRHASRVVALVEPTDEDLTSLTAVDVPDRVGPARHNDDRGRRMKRVGALVLAIAMIVGAVLLRNQIDGGSDDDGGGGSNGDEPFRLACATELSDVCNQVANGRDDIDLTVVDPGTTADALADPERSTVDFDAWLVDGPWPQIVADNRAFQNLDAPVLGTSSKVLARSPVMIATQASGRAALETSCEGEITWKCIGEQVPNGQRVGLPTPERGDGLAALASATNSYFAPESYSSVDFEDPGFSGWFDQLTDLSVSTRLGRQTPLARAVAAAGTFSTVGAVESQTSQLLRENKQYVAIYPSPMVTADVVLAPRAGLDADDALDTLGSDEVTAALKARGWRIGGAAPAGASDPPSLPKGSGMPSPGVLQTLRDLW